MPKTPAGESLQEALQCNKCNSQANFAEEAIEDCYNAGEMYRITCKDASCRASWNYCSSCRKRFISCATAHASRKRHCSNRDVQYPPGIVATANVAVPNDAAAVAVANNDTNDAATSVLLAPEFLDEIGDMFPDDLYDKMDEELNATYIDNADSGMDIIQAPAADEDEQPVSPFPSIPTEGNEWLFEFLKSKNHATTAEMHQVFARPDVAKMKNFWLAELASGPGKCGGGMMYLAAKAFQQVRDAQLDKTKFPSFREAMFQFDNLVQYQSMNEKQRKRHCRITKTIMEEVSPNDDCFFQHTDVPNSNALGRYYGRTGQHSMYENLPIPRTRLIGGVAYNGPRAVITFLMANGVPIDDIGLRLEPLNDADDQSEKNKRIHHIEDAPETVAWLKSVREHYYGDEILNSGAPNLDSDASFAAPKAKEKVAVCCTLSHWKDGFGPNAVKNNRGSIDVKTFTVSPPKKDVNGTGNTCAVAIGLKTSHKGWEEVEHEFNRELKELCGKNEPTYFFHGATQKIVPMFFLRGPYVADKVETLVITSTIGFASDLHRTFGYVGVIRTPSCDSARLKTLFGRLEATEFGWSFQYINPDANGAAFAACPDCREKGLRKLGVLQETGDDDAECEVCANWDVMSTTLNEEGEPVLDFPKHKDYPKKFTAGSPVEAPPGRDEFDDVNGKLPFVKLTWELMIQACKFSFFQASRKKGQAWTKAATVMYLKTCGVAPKLAELVVVAAQACRRAQEMDGVDYEETEKIGEFRFPAAWLSDVEMLSFIETIMHLLGLGIGVSNFELITAWLKALPGKAKMSSTGFRNAVQPLLQDLKPFMLAWLQAHPFTGETKDLKTGAWVAENWLTIIRLSKILYGWCAKDSETASHFGANDVSRMVICFQALVARLLTHSGIDDDLIAEVELYIQEFLSCVRELDVRVRFKKLGKKVAKVSDRKGTEAWWLKSNYMCLRNLVSMMLMLGPLVNWWDGGGKGERFIQSVKPHIQRGIRHDVLSFFVTLLEKLFKVMQIGLLEKRYGVAAGSAPPGEDAPAVGNDGFRMDSVMDILNEVADAMSDEEDASSIEEDDGSTGSENDEHIDEEDDEESKKAYVSTEMEDHGMTKVKTIYIYRNANQLQEAITACKPLAGIVEVKTMATGETAFEFQVIFRKPVKLLARRQINFNDDNGVNFHGMWWSEITVEAEKESLPPTKELSDIQSVAKFSAVAIPLRYVIGDDKADSSKYCVITNWWKERMSDGAYELPTLDPDLYSANEYEGEALNPEFVVVAADSCSETEEGNSSDEEGNQDTNHGRNGL